MTGTPNPTAADPQRGTRGPAHEAAPDPANLQVWAANSAPVPDVGSTGPANTEPSGASRDARRRRGVLLIALGILIPVGVGSVANLSFLFEDRAFEGSAATYSILAAAGVGIVLTLVGLVLLFGNRPPSAAPAQPSTRSTPSAREVDEVDAALDEAIQDAEEHSDEPSVLLDAPTGLPWERR